MKKNNMSEFKERKYAFEGIENILEQLEYEISNQWEYGTVSYNDLQNCPSETDEFRIERYKEDIIRHWMRQDIAERIYNMVYENMAKIIESALKENHNIIEYNPRDDI